MLVKPLPDVFDAYRKIGGVLEFVLFDHCPDTDPSFHEAIGATIKQAMSYGPDGSAGAPSIDRDRLDRLSWRPLTRKSFLGCWVDAETETLRRRGEFTTSRARRLIDPSYGQLAALQHAGERIASGAQPVPDLWAGGEFAYAFSEPPYGLWGTPEEVQTIFTAVLALILPPDQPLDIRDWGSPELPDVCPDYFQPGTEWWGVFLFTIQNMATQTLTVIVGSSTD